jgi:RNA polymerase sigma factor (TIGR02999 family)
MALDTHTVTRILADFGTGEDAARELLPRVYDELRRLAASHFEDERPDHTLQPTALVNEAFLRMADDDAIRVTNRAHFFRLASKVMRQILVDHARGKDARKRGGMGERITLDDSFPSPTGPEVDLLVLEEALERLTRFSPDKARLVELRFFGGLTIEEAAGALNISRTQATREWRTARAWLADELSKGGHARHGGSVT